MSRIFKQPRSPYFFADYLSPDGSRRRVSTKRTDKESAQIVLHTLMAAEMLASDEQLTPERARELIGQTAERTRGNVKGMIAKLLTVRQRAKEERMAEPSVQKMVGNIMERATGKPLEACKIRD